MDFNNVVTGAAGIGVAIISSGFGGKFLWNWIQRERDEKPRYKVAQDERDAADVRATTLWTRNQILEGIIQGLHKSHAQEREELYSKIEALTKSLAEARQEIVALSNRVEDLANASKSH